MRAIKYPFRINEFGRVEATNDFGKLYLDRVITLVSTIVNQRFMSSEYGVNYRKSLYENGGAFQKAMEEAIREAVAIWLPEITISSYISTAPNSEGVSQITMLIAVPNGKTLSLTFQTFTVDEDGNLSRSQNV